MRPSLKELKKALHYDPVSGLFTWRLTRGGMLAGEQAGYVRKDGYLIISWLGQPLYGHHVAWFYVTGEWPRRLDHRNLKRSDNRFLNLRLATHSQNRANSGVRRVGRKGVTLMKSGKFMAQTKFEGRRYYLGLFDTEEAAHAAYTAKAAELFAEFVCATRRGSAPRGEPRGDWQHERLSGQGSEVATTCARQSARRPPALAGV